MNLRRFHIPLTSFIAFRYIRSRTNRRFISFITFIAIVGVTLGVASLIITLSILDGFEKTIKSNVISFTAHMQLFGFDNQILPNPDRAMQRVMERYPDVTEIAPYLAREGMIRSTGDIDGVLIKGVDPSNDISAARRRLVEGTYSLEEAEMGLQGIIIGKRLAERLRVEIGGKVIVYALGGTSLSLAQTRIMQFEVRGIYETGMAEYDGTFVYVNLKSAQRLFQVGRAVSGFDIMVSDVDKLSTLAEEIPLDLGYPYFARTMHQMYKNLFTWIELQKKPIPIILGLIIIVATVNVIGTLLMMVLEKAKEIGTLRTLGMRKHNIVRIFVSQGILIGLIGTVLGNAIAYGLCWLELTYRLIPLPSGIYFMTHVPIDLSLQNFMVVSASALVMCFLSSLIPARLAARLDPVRTLRFA
ncbi:MAG: ABC transporter permease [Ignavibacteriales bacterium]|nr:ABC transporter permease [Ignavibacteriales bacterium]